MRIAAALLVAGGCASASPSIAPLAPGMPPPQAAYPHATDPALEGAPLVAASMPLFEPPPGPITDYCRPQLQRLVDGRADAAAFGTSQELERTIRSIWEGCRTELDEEEAKRLRQAKAEAARQDAAFGAALRRQQEEGEAERMVSDPDFAVPRLSFAICQAQAERADALHEIAEEKRIARTTGGGVVDLKAIYEWQGTAADAERKLAAALAAVRAFGRKPLPCNSAAVREFE